MTDANAKINKNRWLILCIVIMMTFMSCVDSSIVNVALPTIASNLHADTFSVSWVVTVYLIIITALILFFGKLADLTGKTRCFNYGIVLFTLGSLFCGLSNSLVLLLIARAIQAIGAAAAMATTQGIIAEAFPAKERGRALGISGSSVALGSMAGPVLGGLIVNFYSWHYIFLINLPIGIAAFILGSKFLPKDNKKLENKKSLDGIGVVLFALSMIILFATVSIAENLDFINVLVLVLFLLAIVVSICLFVLFIFVERKNDMPMLDLSIFRNSLFSLSVFCAFISFSVISCTSILLPFYLQELLRMSPSAAGLIIMSSPIVLALTAPISGYLSDHFGSEFLTFLGLSIMTVGMILMGIFFNADTSVILIIVFIGMISLGNGMFQSPNTSLIMSTVPKNKYGIAGSINALVRNAGLVFGVTFSTILLYNRMSSSLGHKILNYTGGDNNAFIYAMHFVVFSVAGICLLGVILTWIRLYGWKLKKHKEV
ncbi:MAG: MFS transporter [Bacillota bacterium]|nr:MFS transporter [Bacillota bacterium]